MWPSNQWKNTALYFFSLVCALFSRKNYAKNQVFLGSVSLRSFRFKATKNGFLPLVSRSDVTMRLLKFTSITQVSSVAKGID